jgi:hypothetical protein
MRHHYPELNNVGIEGVGMFEQETVTLTVPELELMATGSQPVDDRLRTWGYSVTLTVKMHVDLFSNPVNTINDNYHGGDHDIDDALAKVAQAKLNDLTKGKGWRYEVEVIRVEGREVTE